MDDDEVVWPTGMSYQDPAARDRPLVFNPQGFLVAILEDADQADQARATLGRGWVRRARPAGLHQPADPGQLGAVPGRTQPRPACRRCRHRRPRDHRALLRLRPRRPRRPVGPRRRRRRRRSGCPRSGRPPGAPLSPLRPRPPGRPPHPLRRATSSTPPPRHSPYWCGRSGPGRGAPPTTRRRRPDRGPPSLCEPDSAGRVAARSWSAAGRVGSQARHRRGDPC